MSTSGGVTAQATSGGGDAQRLEGTCASPPALLTRHCQVEDKRADARQPDVVQQVVRDVGCAVPAGSSGGAGAARAVEGGAANAPSSVQTAFALQRPVDSGAHPRSSHGGPKEAGEPVVQAARAQNDDARGRVKVLGADARRLERHALGARLAQHCRRRLSGSSSAREGCRRQPWEQCTSGLRAASWAPP